MRRVLFLALAALCVVLAAADFLYETHPYFDVEKVPAFYGLYGLIASLLLVAVGRVFAAVLKRPEDYYDE